MSDVIYLRQDVQANYRSEAGEFARLSGTVLTTTGSGSFISASSSTTYNYTAGTQDLYNQLFVVLEDNAITAVDWNTVRSFIYGEGVPMTNNVKQQLVKTNGVLTEYRLFQADGTTLMVKKVLNRINNRLSTVDNYVYDTNGTTVLALFTQTLNRINGSLDNVVITVTV